MIFYHYCGLKIASPFEFPELKESSPQRDPEIVIESAKLSLPTCKNLRYGPNWAVSPEQAYWWIDSIVKFRITPEKIEIDAHPRAHQSLVRSLLLEAPMTLAIQYRGEFCLAASAISDGDSTTAYRFVPGGGASTTAAWQVCRRYKTHYLMSDSLLRISIDDTGRPLAWPQGSGVLLWPKSRKVLGLEDQSVRLVRPELHLGRLQLRSEKTAKPLSVIYTASRHNRLEESLQVDQNLKESRRPFKFAALRTAGRLWVDAMHKSPDHFAWCLSVAKHCKIQSATEPDLYP